VRRGARELADVERPGAAQPNQRATMSEQKVSMVIGRQLAASQCVLAASALTISASSPFCASSSIASLAWSR